MAQGAVLTSRLAYIISCGRFEGFLPLRERGFTRASCRLAVGLFVLFPSRRACPCRRASRMRPVSDWTGRSNQFCSCRQSLAWASNLSRSCALGGSPRHGDETLPSLPRAANLHLAASLYLSEARCGRLLHRTVVRRLCCPVCCSVAVHRRVACRCWWRMGAKARSPCGMDVAS